MQRLVWLWTLVLMATTFMHLGVAFADDREMARAWFEQGVGHASRQEWPQAADAFERSRALDERVPTLFNLMLAYDALGRPLDVARTVRLFLTRADPSRHQPERARALDLEAKAYAVLARVSIQSQPLDTQILVDGAIPIFAADAKTVLLTPGKHELRCTSEGHEPETIAVEVLGGERRVLNVVLKESALETTLPQAPPVSGPAVETHPGPLPMPAAEASAPIPDLAPWRRPVARAFAIVGAATWIASASVLAASYARARKLQARDSTEPGFLTASDDYQRMSRAVVPLSFVSAGVLITAAAAWPRARRWFDWAALGTGLALVAAGAALAAGTPPAIEGTGLDQPRRQLGVFLGASGAPLIAFPFSKPAR